MAEKEKILTGIDEVEAGFSAEPEISPIERVEMESFVVSEAEIERDLEDAGLQTPQHSESTPVPVEDTAIGIEEDSFLEEPELSPIEQLEVDEFIASPAEIEEDMKKAGLE